MAFWKFGIALVAVGLGGCQTPGVADYTPSRDTLSYLQQVGGTRVSVGSFGNTPESLADATDTGLFSACSLKVADDPDWTGPSGYIRNALVEELTVGGLYAEQDAPVIDGAIETLSFTRDPVFGGAWDIAVVLTGADGAQFRHENRFKFDVGALGGPTVCRRAIDAFQPAVVEFWESAARSPQFRAFLKNR
ncbi:hypothetical protein [Croceicoccus sp. YJ47]|uniref:hypothetical protein n=1 Tax=Croceicoccus sp. YJ47 TaxID=2798724 RepID=UPI0019232556|nr:hypothetical protein [Croceicoccus sp. YJ47]QQN75459.1 hypothetical protein JD971_07510 [Croceicoccus sp. YJ47]